MSKFLFVLILSLFGYASYSQDKFDLRYDTLLIKDVVYAQKWPKVKIDSVCLELYYDNARIAILPLRIMPFIDKNKIEFEGRDLETLKNNNKILRIKFYMKK